MENQKINLTPQFIPVKCPICSGWKTVGFKKIPCSVCNGLGYIKVPPKEEVRQ